MRKEGSPLLPYLMALLAPLAVAAAMLYTWPFFREAPVAVYLVAVVAAAWYGGLGPGLLSACVSLLLTGYFFVAPYYFQGMPGQGDLLRLAALAAVGVMVSLLSESLHRSRWRVESQLEGVTRSEEQYRVLFEANLQAEESLRKSQEQLAAVIASAMDAIITVGEDQRIVLFNEAAEKMFRSPAAKALGQSIDLFIPARFRSTHAGHIVDFGRTHVTRRAMAHLGSLYGLRADGEEFPIEASISQIESGGRKFYTVILRDITERRRAEEALRESEERLQTVIENLTEGLVISTPEGHLLHWNRAGLEMHGFRSLEEGRRWLPEFTKIFELATLDGKVLTVEEWPLPRIFRGEKLNGYEVRIRRVDGGDWERIYSYGGSIVYDASGRRLAFVTITDITERKRAEEALLRAAAIIENSEDAIISADLKGAILSWNPGAERLYGYTAAEVIGRPFTMLIPPDRPDEEAHIREQIRRGELIAHYETVRRHKDGTLIDVSLTVSPVRDAAGHVVGASKIARDITERKRAQQEVLKLNEELERRVADRTAQLQAANRELEAFSYSVSHDLRAPLRHINGFSQALLEDYADRLDDVGKGYLQDVREASRQMAQLIDDVLNLARVTRTEMRREEVDLSEVARAVVADLRRGDPGREAEVGVEDGLVALGDRRLLQIVLVNLLGNAWKFTSRRGRAEISFGRERRDGEGVFFVRDNGAGFDMAYAGKLFGTFQRLHSVREFEGTGVGLATVMRIVTRHGGRVWAEGEVGRGATFYFALPDNKEGVE